MLATQAWVGGCLLASLTTLGGWQGLGRNHQRQRPQSVICFPRVRNGTAGEMWCLGLGRGVEIQALVAGISLEIDGS